MKASDLYLPQAFAALGIFVLASSARAQDAPTSPPPSAGAAAKNTSSSDATGKPAKKVKPASASAGEKKPKAGQFTSEAEARAHCRGTIVWVDQDHFNHYAGSREYGKKPGAFTCENG